MQSGSTHSGDLSQDSAKPEGHLTPVIPSNVTGAATKAVIDPTARASRKAYQGLSSASVGLELGLAVIIGLVIGIYMDRWLGTTPWLMLVWLGFGFVAGFRGVMRAVRREDREAARG
jgi:ATP synthase protein I